MFSIVTLPTGFIASTTGYMGDLFNDLWVVIALVIGLGLGMWLLRRVTGLVRLR